MRGSHVEAVENFSHWPHSSPLSHPVVDSSAMSTSTCISESVWEASPRVFSMIHLLDIWVPSGSSGRRRLALKGDWLPIVDDPTVLSAGRCWLRAPEKGGHIACVSRLCLSNRLFAPGPICTLCNSTWEFQFSSSQPWSYRRLLPPARVPRIVKLSRVKADRGQATSWAPMQASGETTK